MKDQQTLSMERIFINGWYLDQTSFQLTKADVNLQLTPKSCALLELLFQADLNVVTRETLLAKLWPDSIVSDDSLTNLVSTTRQLLKNAQLDKVIETMPKQGYRLKANFDKPEQVEKPSAKHKPNLKLLAAIGVFIILTMFIALKFSSVSAIRLVVFPLKSNGESDVISQYFNNEIHHQSSQLSGIEVIPQSTLASHIQSNLPVPNIADNLQANYWLEGHIEQLEDNFIITLQLVEQGKVIFSQKFEGKVKQLVSDAERISQIISANIGYTLQDELKQSLTSVDPQIAKQRCENYIELAYLYVDLVLVNVDKIVRAGEQACHAAVLASPNNAEVMYSLAEWYLSLAKAYIRDEERKQSYLALSEKYSLQLQSLDRVLYIRQHLNESLLKLIAAKRNIEQITEIINTNIQLVNSIEMQSISVENKLAIYNSYGISLRYGAVFALRYGQDPNQYFLQAEQAFSRALAIDSENYVILGSYARLMKTQADHAIKQQLDPRKYLYKAIELYQLSLQLEDKASSVKNNLANAYSTLTKWLAKHEHDYKESLQFTEKVYQEVLTETEKNHLVYNNLSDLYAGLANFGAIDTETFYQYINAGLQASEQAMTIKPDYDWPLFNQGYLHFLQTRFQLSQQNFNVKAYQSCKKSNEKALARRPNIAEAYVTAAQCEYFHSVYLLKERKNEKVKESVSMQLQLINSALKINENLASAYILQAKSYLMLFAVKQDKSKLILVEQAVNNALAMEAQNNELQSSYLTILASLAQITPSPTNHQKVVRQAEYYQKTINSNHPVISPLKIDTKSDADKSPISTGKIIETTVGSKQKIALRNVVKDKLAQIEMDIWLQQ